MGRRRGAPLRPDTLGFPTLAAPREQLRSRIVELAHAGDPTAIGLRPDQHDLLAPDRDLDVAPATPAAELYTGVLYDALDLASLDPASRRRAHRRLVVVSALFGALQLTDRVPPYRLSMGARPPGVGPLAAYWRPWLAAALPPAAGRGLVVDCRSSDYVAAWRPTGDLAERWVHVVVPGASHGAKHTRGLVARALSQAAADPRRPDGLLAHLGGLDAELSPPARLGRPWELAVRG